MKLVNSLPVKIWLKKVWTFQVIKQHDGFGCTPLLLFRFLAVWDELSWGYNCCHRKRQYLTFYKELSKIFRTAIFLYFSEFLLLKYYKQGRAFDLTDNFFWKCHLKLNASCQKVLPGGKNPQHLAFLTLFSQVKKEECDQIIEVFHINSIRLYVASVTCVLKVSALFQLK